jgi:hypothetical protein
VTSAKTTGVATAANPHSFLECNSECLVSFKSLSEVAHAPLRDCQLGSDVDVPSDRSMHVHMHMLAGIPIGKLDLYVAAGGFHPTRVLPVVLDVGTNNVRLREHPLYPGLHQPRLSGPAYVEFVDEFVTAVTQRYPQAVLQFEDFSIDRALPLLERYRYDHLVFNDDIQVWRCVEPGHASAHPRRYFSALTNISEG